MHRLGSRRSLDTVQVEIPQFAPNATAFLSMTAFLELSLYEAATLGVSGAKSLRAKETLAEVAGEALAKHHALTDELKRRDVQPHEAMRAFAPVVAAYRARVSTDDWHQHVLTIWLVGGLFESFFCELAKGLKDRYKSQAIALLHTDEARSKLRELLADEIQAQPSRADLLAVWGRRLVGDTLLIAQEVLSLSEYEDFDSSKMDPVFTELTAEHMRRMDSLGLTA